MLEPPSLFRLALTYILIMNPMGNLPVVISLIKDFPLARQKVILLREGLFTIAIALTFQFIGEYFLSLLRITPAALSLCGGALLVICALNMIFPKVKSSNSTIPLQEPYIVPIATPLLAGPGALTFIMVTAAREPSTLKITAAILLAGSAILTVLLLGPYVQRLLGRRGMGVLEQIMGMTLLLMAVAMALQGIETFIKSL